MVPSPYFHLAWFYPLVMLLTSVELLQVLLISAIRIRFLMRTGLNISREKCVLKMLPEGEQHTFPNQTNSCWHLFAMRVVAEVSGFMLINKGTPVRQSIKAANFSSIDHLKDFIKEEWTLNHCHEHKILLCSRAIQLKVSGIPLTISPRWSESLSRKCC